MKDNINVTALMTQTTEYTPEQMGALMEMRNALSNTTLSRIAAYGSPRTIAAATALVNAERDSKDAGRRIGQAVYIMRETGNWKAFTGKDGKTYSSFTKFVENELPEDWDAKNLINYGAVFEKFGGSSLLDRYGMGTLKDLKAVFADKKVTLSAVEYDIGDLELLDNSGKTLTQKQIREYAATIKQQPELAGKYVETRENLKKKNTERERLEQERKKQEAERELMESKKRVAAAKEKKEKEKEKEKEKAEKATAPEETAKWAVKTPEQVQRERAIKAGNMLLEKIAMLHATQQEGVVFQWEGNTFTLFAGTPEVVAYVEEEAENTKNN